MISDLDHYYGSDLSVSSTGDLAITDSVIRSQQRVLRRLLTNPGDYEFHPDYGAGLGQYVGAVIDTAKVTALIRNQMFLEDSVMRIPEPVITVQVFVGGVTVNIQYTENESKTPALLSFDVSK